ncbi:MAG: flippase [Candidatus Lernaella stagnicola]|nr:flippase [Candidatus Lernaella stagnicola]
MSAFARIAKNTAALAVGNLIAKLLSLVFLAYMARRLGDIDFGRFSVAMALVGLVAVIPNYIARPYIIREIARRRDSVSRMLTQISITNILLALAVFGALALVAPHLGYHPRTVQAIVILGFALVFDATTASYHATLAGFERMELSAALNVFNTVTTVALGGAMLASGYGLIPLVSMYAVAKALTLLLALRFLRGLEAAPDAKLDVPLMNEMLRATWPFFITTLFIIFYARLDIVMLSFFKRDAAVAEVGYYNAAYKVMEGLGLVTASFVSAMYPFLARLFVDNRDRLRLVFRRALRYLLAFVLPAATGLAIIAWDLMPLMFGPEFAPAAAALAILVWGQALDSINPLLAQTLRATDREWSVAKVTGIGAAFNFAANLALIPSFGLYGAAVATVASFALVLAINQHILRRALGAFDIAGPLARTVLATAIMAIVLIAMSRFVLHEWSPGGRLAVLIVLGAIVYSLAATALGVADREDRRFLRDLIRRKSRRSERN